MKSKKTREEVIESARKRDRARNKKPERIRWMKNKDLTRHFGITVEEFDRMVKEQNSLCAICRNPETWTRNGKLVDLSVDHNHVTGQVRGLLCYQCNTALGKLKESVEAMKSMISYVEMYK